MCQKFLLEGEIVSEESCLFISSYQQQYKKNLGLIKIKYKTRVSSDISLQEIQKIAEFVPHNTKHLDVFIKGKCDDKKLYCFLCSLAVYEIETLKFHDFFELEDWNLFAESLNLLSKDDVFLFKDKVFKKNLINYTWSQQEDELLQTITAKYKKKDNHRMCWSKIAEEFNLHACPLQIRTSAHCQERWKNTLRLQFKKGEWTSEEDRKIISFVLENGTKWSLLAKFFSGRTEHNMKNRFFSILSKNLSLPIKKIKKNVNYTNTKILDDVLKELL